jgi:hypothetical protein
MFLCCLVLNSKHLRTSPQQKAILDFYRVVHRTIRCTTEQSLFMSGARSPSISGVAHRCSSGPNGVSSAHRIVRCTQPTIGAGHVSRVDRANDRCCWRHCLTGQSGAPPDSPVNYSHVSFFFSREWRVRRWWLTGQSGAPPDSPVNYSRVTREQPVHHQLACTTGNCPVHHRTVRCARPELIFGCTQPRLFQCISSFLGPVSSN